VQGCAGERQIEASHERQVSKGRGKSRASCCGRGPRFSDSHSPVSLIAGPASGGCSGRRSKPLPRQRRSKGGDPHAPPSPRDAPRCWRSVVDYGRSRREARARRRQGPCCLDKELNDGRVVVLKLHLHRPATSVAPPHEPDVFTVAEQARGRRATGVAPSCRSRSTLSRNTPARLRGVRREGFGAGTAIGSTTRQRGRQHRGPRLPSMCTAGDKMKPRACHPSCAPRPGRRGCASTGSPRPEPVAGGSCPGRVGASR